MDQITQAKTTEPTGRWYSKPIRLAALSITLHTILVVIEECDEVSERPELLFVTIGVLALGWVIFWLAFRKLMHVPEGW